MKTPEPSYSAPEDKSPIVAKKPRYRLLEQAVIDGVLHEKGEEIEYEGEPGPHMELIEGEAPVEAKKPDLDPSYLDHPQDKSEPGTGRRK